MFEDSVIYKAQLTTSDCAICALCSRHGVGIEVQSILHHPSHAVAQLHLPRGNTFPQFAQSCHKSQPLQYWTRDYTIWFPVSSDLIYLFILFQQHWPPRCSSKMSNMFSPWSFTFAAPFLLDSFTPDIHIAHFLTSFSSWHNVTFSVVTSLITLFNFAFLLSILSPYFSKTCISI